MVRPAQFLEQSAALCGMGQCDEVWRGPCQRQPATGRPLPRGGFRNVRPLPQTFRRRACSVGTPCHYVCSRHDRGRTQGVGGIAADSARLLQPRPGRIRSQCGSHARPAGETSARDCRGPTSSEDYMDYSRSPEPTNVTSIVALPVHPIFIEAFRSPSTVPAKFETNVSFPAM